jgi:4-hydroxy-2-oxoheptanedioate aldolase
LLNENWLLKKLRTSQRPCIGTWITIPCATSLDIICSTGPDFVVLDTEHAPMSFETAQTLAITCESRKVSPVIRVPGVHESAIVRSLEVGAHAIQVPNIGSAAMVQEVVNYAKYQPIGNKGLSPYTRACGYTGDNVQRMIEQANKNTILIAQIEGRQGIENVDAILAVEHIDIFFLGMFDLSNFLGIPGALENPKLKTLFAELVKKIDKAGKIVGSISNNVEQLKFLIDAGVRYITHSADCDVLSKAYRATFANRG